MQWGPLRMIDMMLMAKYMIAAGCHAAMINVKQGKRLSQLIAIVSLMRTKAGCDCHNTKLHKVQRTLSIAALATCLATCKRKPHFSAVCTSPVTL